MNEKPEVKLKEWIRAGQRDAVVTHVYNDDFKKDQIEIVYIDDRDRAITDDVFWNGERWESVRNDGSGGYADNSDRLREHVAILRRGKYKGGF